ncbi:hypothetical protein NRB56_10200 [Nocardia sp. RB56]|uniref:Uncharacterized protein n=1 Tax=Nocardia aurantia TaxID=2585199 RepID=A0A7K0DI30_9NOCA|nr:hypothetical protein [Nocardia aurantia]
MEYDRPDTGELRAATADAAEQPVDDPDDER